MTSWRNSFPHDITNRYYDLWTQSLSQIFCLPYVSKRNGEIVNAQRVLDKIIVGQEKLLLLSGEAGSGKTSLISYMCNSIKTNYHEIGFNVWSMPKGANLIPIVMGEAMRYADTYDYSKMILVLENDNGFQINLEEICRTISERQLKKRYDNLSVIITCRLGEVAPHQLDFIECVRLQPFSNNQIEAFCEKYNSLREQNDISFLSIKKVVEILGTNVCGNPLFLQMLVNNIEQAKNIDSSESLYSFILLNQKDKKDIFLCSEIAKMVFLQDNECVAINEILQLGISRDKIKELGFFESSHNSVEFLHHTLYEFSLSVWILNKINSLPKEEAFKNLLMLFSKKKMSRSLISYIKAGLRFQTSISWSQLQQLCEEAIRYLWFKWPHSLSFQNNDQESLLLRIEKEMCTFYNLHHVYHVIAVENGLYKMQVYDENKKYFVRYISLYSSYYGEFDFDLSHINLSEYDFQNLNLANVDLSGCNLNKCNFSRSILRKSKLKNASLTDSSLFRADLSAADLEYSNLSRTDLSGSLLYQTNLRETNLRLANLQQANMTGANCQSSNLYCANLEAANCCDTNFSSANLRSSYFVNAILRNTILDNADLTDTFLPN